ncbi:MAG: hypothetical protein ABR540_10690 [Acidimicrobiales bacterium]|nr:hypothetical protein [Actinomycetota bacterium]
MTPPVASDDLDFLTDDEQTAFPVHPVTLVVGLLAVLMLVWALMWLPVAFV